MSRIEGDPKLVKYNVVCRKQAVDQEARDLLYIDDADEINIF